MKVFAFEWIEKKKRMEVSMPMTGSVVGNVPGKWRPRSLFSQAGRLIMLFVGTSGCPLISPDCFLKQRLSANNACLFFKTAVVR